MVNEKDNFVVSIGIGKDGEAKIRFSSDVEIPLTNVSDLLSNLNPVLEQIGDKDMGLVVEMPKNKAKKKKVVKRPTKTKKVAPTPLKRAKKGNSKQTTKKKTTKRK